LDEKAKNEMDECRKNYKNKTKINIKNTEEELKKQKNG